ncbi:MULTISPECIES: hypothetical protein [Lysinibacillus]|uniref:Uncharacterized protein n=1 Tax=Lysinibacillus pinottii TaxID=2973932 RepID=A0ABT2DNT4_9BACI|nr:MULTISPECIES: hypothetical protein [Lysinibacillus]MCS1396057.1 hypothetical protein [Lysinibacillus sp. PB211]MDR0159206.1 hypothetical protein [Lysinibacillus sphaericus]
MNKVIRLEFAPITPERDAELKSDSTKHSMIMQGKQKGQYNTDFDRFKYQRLLTVEVLYSLI